MEKCGENFPFLFFVFGGVFVSLDDGKTQIGRLQCVIFKFITQYPPEMTTAGFDCRNNRSFAKA